MENKINSKEGRDEKGRFVKGLIPKHKGISKLKLSKEVLEDLYLNKKVSTKEISQKFNVSDSVVRKRLKYFNIPVRGKVQLLKEWYDNNKDTEYFKELHLDIGKKTGETNKRLYKEGKRELYGIAKLSHENPEMISGKNNPFYGKKHSDKTLNIMERNNYSNIRGKTKKEIFGEEKANQIKIKTIISQKEANKHKDYISSGKKISETKKRLISEGKLNPLKGNKRISKPEEIIRNLIKKYNLPFMCTGNGSVFIGGFNPDFLNEELKKIIEVDGDYWHNREDIKNKDIKRMETYNRLGYNTLIIWEHEIIPRWKKQLTEEQLVNKIRDFIK